VNRFLRTLAVAALAACPILAFADDKSHLEDGDNVAVIGDSITEQKIYSEDIEDYLLMCQPAAVGRVMQFGWSGETAEGFKNRMANDCFRYKPTVATTCYGMNDGRYKAQTPENAKWYEQNQRAVVKAMKKAGVRFIVVGSSGCVDVQTFHFFGQTATVYNPTLADERDISKKVAEEEGVAFADLYDPMYEVMTKAEAKYGPKYHLCGGDGVHPDQNGHLVMAYAFLKALGCDGNIGTIRVDLAAKKAEASDGHKILSDNNGTVEVESTRYPYCFYGEPASPNSTRGILEFLPFNEDLNRFTLIVTGATGKQKVTWGKESKTFDADQLAKGINLAAEFMDNPFSEPFMQAHKAVQKQQNFETPMVKTWVHNLPMFRNDMPDDVAKYEAILTDMNAKDETLFTASKAAVQPVKHTIRIEKGE
jgi:lysophospholipase L1-like esterase